MSDKRKLYLIDPKFQVRFSLYLGFLIFISNAFFSAVVWMRYNHTLILLESGLFSIADTQEMRGRFLFMLVGILISCSLLAALAGLFFSHRIAGPIYKLKKFLMKIREENYRDELNLRQGDYFPEIADEINKTVAQLRGDEEIGEDKS